MATILTPLEFSGTETLSRRLFRKKVLPIDSIDYNGRKIDFTQEYLQTVVDSFNDGAFDNVPLQFADASNAHTNDPERYRGDVVAMELASDGLYVTVSATPDGAKVLQENSKLGISARIVNDYDRSDGKKYQAAVQHVLATHDPRIPGLGPWASVESFSNDNDKSDIIDLTDSEFRVNSDTKTKKGKSVDQDNTLSADELTQLRALLADLDADKADEGADVDADASDEELTDEELAALIAEAELDDEGDKSDEADADEEVEAKVPATAGAELSNTDDKTAVELSNQAVELANIRKELAESKWEKTRLSLMQEYNLPPAVVDRAAPVLKLANESGAVELSNGTKTNAAAVMKDVLQEVGNLVKLLDLSNELGTGVEQTPDRSADAAARRDETTKAVRAMMGS